MFELMRKFESATIREASVGLHEFGQYDSTRPFTGLRLNLELSYGCEATVTLRKGDEIARFARKMHAFGTSDLVGKVTRVFVNGFGVDLVIDDEHFAELEAEMLATT